ncbi:acetylserotonin O-methyltransferase-like isoform X2 [Microcaecilia unicolor]|uniref:Acetylserotonin O-methyltransferase-like isoform X2 n=1 Tax=Microcaecilia unicolor TaxID=1415580 RepID=A0A6P7XYH1_9AMPH|nr:acetylserotonin O-methyltransferase-like isoform X2 [Microcaecilia unicolor]
MMIYYSQTLYLCWHFLTDAVREGKNQFKRAFGVSSKNIFEDLYRSEEEMIKFMHLMNSVWTLCSRDVIKLFDLSPFTTVCDLGGCSGALAKECISIYPESMVTIYDLPKVVQTAKKHFISTDEHRISFQEEVDCGEKTKAKTTKTDEELNPRELEKISKQEDTNIKDNGTLEKRGGYIHRTTHILTWLKFGTSVKRKEIVKK